MRAIVTTTINRPTEALRRFAAMTDWTLVVVGDTKTPHAEYANWGPCVYISPSGADAIDTELSELIGWNCIQRRNMGFVRAWQAGAEVVATVDDDNIPLDGWGEYLAVGKSVECDDYEVDCPAFDPLSATNHPELWHRGFPVESIWSRGATGVRRTVERVAVQADLWNGTPDIDAVCRLQYPQDVMFSVKPRPFFSRKLSPFNSQNTFLSRDALRDYFCFPGIGRMDDIWGGYVCQAAGHRVVYGNASVHQARNPHDNMRDFVAETEGYARSGQLVAALMKDPEGWRRFVPERAAKAFDRYREIMK